MARAKRTSSERAAARRRYRAANDEAALEGAEHEESEPPQGASGTQTRPVAPGARMSIVAALRESVHPLRLRDDLAAIPALATDKSFLIPLAVTVASTVAVLATGGRDTITAILFAYFVQTPAIGGVFLAGFLAPRASWLIGAVIGLVSAVGYIVVLVTIPGALTTTATQPEPATVQSIGTSALLLSPLMGALFAAAAAWYRRFLTLSNPNRGRRAQAAAKRGADGRTRATGQKAGVRR